ncbi:uncharacterized protein SCHCODRAFT_01240123 [Schizophyllum commune H4-8]|uniref:uncharacterized protein n=1 Tax=Schizophyllum commune (strain H4-8 / FGSC 9210) TaxID=578458 RepID=UPI00215E5FA8|nr:uncharacterized protein SCHCODRAFT_01240123 [Schizophyllum commune H4-8]KAI5887699.1 hypothetical protein SCHCODRAFT_01240123 [Schizophyllum commune H4-8]
MDLDNQLSTREIGEECMDEDRKTVQDRQGDLCATRRDGRPLWSVLCCCVDARRT